MVVLNLLVKPSWLLAELIVQERISHEQYGVYAALFSLSFLFINLCDMGLNVYVTKRLATEKDSLKHIFSNTFGFKLLICFLYPLFMVSVGWLLGYQGEKLYFLLMLSFVQVLLQTVYFFRSALQAHQFFKTDALASVADKVFLLVVVLLLFANTITLESFIYAVLGSAVLTFVIFYGVVIKLYGWIRPVVHAGSLRAILKLSFPFALVGLLYAVNEKIDMVMVERLGGEWGARNAGLYAASYRWLDAFMMYLWTILPIFFAKFSIHHKEPLEQQKLFNIGQVITLIPMLFVGTFIFLYGDKLFWVFDSSTLEDLSLMTHILKILFVSAIVQGFFAIYGTYLNSTGHETNVSKMVVVSIFINVLLNVIFIPAYGPLAAAYTTLTSTVFICVGYIIYISKKTTLKIPGNILLRLAFIALIFIGIFYILSLTSLKWYINTAISGILLILITYISNVGGIKNILKKN